MAEDIYEKIVSVRSKGLRAALAIIIAKKGATPRKDSAKMLVLEDGRQIGSVGGGDVEAEVCREAMKSIESEKPKLLAFDLMDIDHDERALVCGGSMEVYVEPILPDPVLFIFGAGHVCKAVADAAALIGFTVKVLDDRLKYAAPERFPGAEVLLIRNWEKELEKIAFSTSSYIFIATQRPATDALCLRFAAKSRAKYIGMLGSKKKTQLIFDALLSEGIDRSGLERVHVPAGLDIDSETPEEIAASIAAELIAA
ncbi:MAG TPA: XdhC/CoxI family protein, partial [Acidobacteriota bacterium]|nr:XdhC/CoxI family protein [Acidobacteriota bacterium]